MAGFFQARVAVRANLPVGVNLAAAARAERFFFDGLQERLFLKRALVFIFQRVPRAQKEIHQDPRQEQHRCYQNRQDAQKRVARAAADIAICPDHQADPQGSDKGGSESGCDQCEIAQGGGIENHPELQRNDYSMDTPALTRQAGTQSGLDTAQDWLAAFFMLRYSSAVQSSYRHREQGRNERK